MKVAVALSVAIAAILVRADAAPWIPGGPMAHAEALKIYRNGTGFVSAVRFNAANAVRCGLRRDAWRAIVVNRARVQLLADGLWMKAYGRVSTDEKRSAQAWGDALAAKMLAMPCSELAKQPLLLAYDAAVTGGTIPMPDLAG